MTLRRSDQSIPIGFYRQGVSYCSAAAELHNIERFLLPKVTLLTFSIECLLKALIYLDSADNKPIQTHNLIKLYDKLGKQHIQEIKEEFDKSRSVKFRNILMQHQQHFIDSRYWFIDIHIRDNDGMYKRQEHSFSFNIDELEDAVEYLIEYISIYSNK